MARRTDVPDNIINGLGKLFGSKRNQPEPGQLMPGGEQPQNKSKNEDTIEMLDFIIGSLAHIFCGEKNITHENIKQHLAKDKDKTIFGRIDNINSILIKNYDPKSSEFGARIAAAGDIILKKITRDKILFDDRNKAFKTFDVGRDKYLDNLSKKLKTITFNVQGIDKLIDREEDVEDAIEGGKTSKNASAAIEVNIDTNDLDLKDVNEKLKDIIKSMTEMNKEFANGEGGGLINNINNFATILDELYKTLDRYGEIDDNETIQKKLNNVLNVIEGTSNAKTKDNKGSLKEITTALSKLNIAEVKPQLKDAFIVISELSNVLKNLESLEVNKAKRNIANLNSLISDSDSSIQVLLDNIQKLTLDNQANVSKSLNVLSNFLESITAILSISPLKVIKAKFSLWLINMLLIDSVQEIITSLNKTKEITESDKVIESFEVFDAFIDSIIKLTEVSIQDRRKMYENTLFIKNYLTKEIVELTNYISDKLNKDATHAQESIKAFYELIDGITKIKDFKRSDFTAISTNLNNLSDLVNYEFKDFISALSNIFVIEKERKEKKIKGFTLRKGSDGKIVNPEQLIENIDSMKNVIDNFNGLFDSLLGIRQYMSISFKLSLLETNTDLINDLLKNANNLNEDDILNNIINDVLPKLKTIFKEIDEINESIKKIDAKIFDSVDNVVKTIDKLSKLSESAALSKISTAGVKALSDHVDSMIEIINSFENVDQENIKKADDTVNALMKIVVGSALVILIAGTVMAFVKVQNLISFTIALSLLLYSVVGAFNLVADKLQDSLDGAKDATLLIIGAGFILIFGGLVMNYVSTENLIVFTATLGLFLLTMGWIFKNFSEGFKDAMLGAQDALILIGGAALIMILGSMAIEYVSIGNLFKFTITLGIFLFTMGLIFYAVGDGFEDAMMGAKDAIILIGGAALILMLGSIAIEYINIKNLLKFTFTLGLFLFVMGGIFTLFSKGFRAAAQGAREATILIGASALILILGSIAWQYIDKKALIEFGATLMLFVGGIMLFFGLASRLAKGALTGAKEVSIIITVSALILVIGSMLITKRIIDTDALVIFGLTLVGFIGGILLIYAFASKRIKNCLPGLIGISILTLVSAGVLIYAGKVITDNEGMLGNIALFGVVLLGFVLGLSLVARLLNKKAGDILKGVGVMGVIMLFVGFSAIVINKLAQVAGQPSFFKNLMIGVGSMFAVITLVGLGAAGVGLLVTGPQALFFAAGAAAIVTILGITLLAAKTINAIADSMKRLNEVKAVNVKSLINNIKGFIEIVKELAPLGDVEMVWTLKKASWALGSLGSVLSKMAKVIKSWSSLTIPIYEGTKITGYETITSDAFPKAADNIKKVVVTLAQAIVDVYDERPDLFDFNITDIFTGGSKFSRVVRSLKAMGPMLSSIASGIKTWSSLKIPQYSGDKISGYITIDKDEFPKAADNIKRVIKTMAQAVVDVYDDNPDLFSFDKGYFGSGIGGSSKFMKVAKSLKNMGPMLSSLASGVKQWADLKIPQYSGEKITGYVTLDKAAFVTAGEHIKQVVKIIAQALFDVYDNNPKLFEIEDDIWSIGGSTKFSKIAKSIGKLGPMLNGIGEALKLWADLKIPKYEGAKIVGYTTLVSKDFDEVGKNINTVVTCLANGLIQAYEGNEEMFEDGWFTDSPFTRVAKSFGKMGPMLKSIADALQMWADLKIPVYKDNSTEIQSYIPLTDEHFTKVGENIRTVVSCLGNAIISLYTEDTKGMFEDSWLTDSPFTKVTKTLVPMGKMLKDIADAVQMWADLKVPIYEAGKTEPVSYVQLTGDDFKKVGEHINEVVSCLAKGVMKVYDENEKTEMFKAAAWHGLGPSKFAKVTKALVPMGDMLKNIAQAVKDWSVLQIPEYDGVDDKGNPKIKRYITIKDNEFDSVAINIGKVVACLASAVGTVYKLNPDYFNSDSWHGFGDSPIAKVASSLEPMGKMLESIANGLKFWADLRIPKYEGTKITGYTTIEDGDFEKISQNISKVITIVGNSIISVVQSNPELFSDDEKSNGVVQAIKAINIGGDAMASIAKTVGNYATGKFQILRLDKDGKWVGGETIKLDAQKLSNLETNVETIICALGRAIVKVYNENKDKGIFFETVDRGYGFQEPVKKDAPIAIVANSINAIAGALNQVMDVISKLVELKTDEVLNKLGGINEAGLVYDFKEIISKFLALGQIIGSQAENFIIKFTGMDGKTYTIAGNNFISVLQSWQKNGTTVIAEFNRIKGLYNSILGKGTEIYQNYESNKTDVDKLVNNSETIYDQLDKTYKLFIKVASVFENSPLNKMQTFINNDELLGNYIITSVRNINRVLNKTKEINEAYEGLKQIDTDGITTAFTNLKDIIDSFDTLIDPQELSTNTAGSIINKGASFVSDLLPDGGLIKSTGTALGNMIDSSFDEKDKAFELLNKKIALILKTSRSVIGLAQEQEKIDPESYIKIATGLSVIWNQVNTIKDIEKGNIDDVRAVLKKIIDNVWGAPPIELFKILADGIGYVYQATAKMQSISNFKDHTEWLKKYIKAVNELNNVNLTSLIEFVTAVDKLSQRLGDLDKLTDAIGNKLSAVLLELVNQLRKADASIENAHKLQQKRKELIEQSVKQVREIMGQHMIVEISQTSTGDDTGGMGGGSISSDVSDNTEPTLPGLANPESVGTNSNNGTSNNATDVSMNGRNNQPDVQVHQGYDQITMSVFKKMCKATFDSKFLKSGI